MIADPCFQLGHFGHGAWKKVKLPFQGTLGVRNAII
jgi:hypothetical protein